MENIQTVIFSKPGCSGCVQAKSFLESKNIPFEELILDVGQPKSPDKKYVSKEFLLEKVPHARTVPQIFLNGQYIGGYSELINAIR